MVKDYCKNVIKTYSIEDIIKDNSDSQHSTNVVNVKEEMTPIRHTIPTQDIGKRTTGANILIKNRVEESLVKLKEDSGILK